MVSRRGFLATLAALPFAGLWQGNSGDKGNGKGHEKHMAGNGLLTGLRGCAEASGSDWVEMVRSVTASLLGGASVSAGALQLVAASSQYASIPHDDSYQFDGAYTLMATVKFASVPPAFGMPPMFKGDLNFSVEPDWYLTFYTDDGASQHGTLEHSTPLHAIWGGDSPGFALQTDHLYTLFGYFTPGVGEALDTITARLYSAGDPTTEATTDNTYDNGSFNSGFPLYFGNDGGDFLDGQIIRCGLWEGNLPDATMDAYWNSGAPLPFSAFGDGSGGGGAVVQVQRRLSLGLGL